jgi:hypothetical protein
LQQARLRERLNMNAAVVVERCRSSARCWPMPPHRWWRVRSNPRNRFFLRSLSLCWPLAQACEGRATDACFSGDFFQTGRASPAANGAADDGINGILKCFTFES